VSLAKETIQHTNKEPQEVIARLPNLRILRLLHPPILVPENQSNDTDVTEYCRLRYEQLADEVLQFLVAEGSPIEPLAFSPTLPLSAFGSLHQPYIRQKMSTATRGLTTTMRAVRRQ
jgi:hypothetical protein